MKFFKEKIIDAISDVVETLELGKNLKEQLIYNSYIQDNTFKVLKTLNYPNLDLFEEEINLNLDKKSKEFKRLVKLSLKYPEYQNIFNLHKAGISIEKVEDGILIATKQKQTLGFIKSKWLKRVRRTFDGVTFTEEEFEQIFPDIRRLSILGLRIIADKAHAKIGIFQTTDSPYFSKEDVFARKAVIDNEEIDMNLFKDKEHLFFNNKLIILDKNFINELKKPEKLTFVDLLRENYNGSVIQQSLKERLEKQLTYKDIEVPKLNNIILEEYQKEGVSWLVNNALNGFGSILADDMGLGKTVQTIASIVALKKQALIVVPTAVLLNWEYEIKTFSNLSVSFYYGSNKKIEDTDVILTTYGTVTYDDDLKNKEWDLVIIDEAQKIKNHDAIITNKLNLIPAKAKIALTGTPVENNLMDLWSIFNFIFPGYLKDKESFKNKFGKRNLTQEEYDVLKKIIDPFILRREKSILPLPEKIVMDIDIKMFKEQTFLYNKVVEEAMKNIELAESPGKRLGIILSTITKTKQVCNHPGQFSPEFMNLDSAKMHKLDELIKDIRKKKEKVIIFTQYVAMGEIIANKYDALMFHGGLNVRERMDMLYNFKKEEFDIMVISLKAGGAGLNIVEANHVIHFDLWFNPAVENQATDRAYRRGQKKDVYVYRFISSGTFEEKINNMLKDKQDIFNKTLNGNAVSFLSKMDTNELHELFSFSEK